jgi:hypothetical protein
MRKVLVCVFLMFFAAGIGYSTTIYSENFDSSSTSAGVYTWTRSSTTYVVRTSTYKVGTYSMRAAYGKYAYKTVSTSGYTGITVSFKLAGYGLDSGEYACFQYRTSSTASWVTIGTLADGSDNKTFTTYTVSLPRCYNNSALRSVSVRCERSFADYGYLDDVVVTALPFGIHHHDDNDHQFTTTYDDYGPQTTTTTTTTTTVRRPHEYLLNHDQYSSTTVPPTTHETLRRLGPAIHSTRLLRTTDGSADTTTKTTTRPPYDDYGYADNHDDHYDNDGSADYNYNYNYDYHYNHNYDVDHYDNGGHEFLQERYGFDSLQRRDDVPRMGSQRHIRRSNRIVQFLQHDRNASRERRQRLLVSRSRGRETPEHITMFVITERYIKKDAYARQQETFGRITRSFTRPASVPGEHHASLL